jgi:pimeloyl-ACP methyl ester carboxylesterase
VGAAGSIWRPVARNGQAGSVTRHVDGIHVVEHPPAGNDHLPPSDAVAGPVVVLVHGSLDRATSFARVVRRLQDLWVVTYDRRGYHHSRRGQHVQGDRRDDLKGDLRGDAFDQHVSDLLEVIGKRRVVVVGHSFGGAVALAAAIEAPERVLAVGAYEPPMPWVDWWPRRARRDMTSEDPADAAEGFFRRMVNDDAWERLPERARQERRAEGPALVAELSSLRSGGAPFDLSRLSVPLVVGRGGASRPHHRQAIDELHSTIPDSVVFEIPGASHGAHLTHPDAFSEFVRRVLSRAEETAEKTTKEPGEESRREDGRGDARAT